MTAPETYLGTHDVPLDELHHFPGNANRGDVGAIRESVRRTGQYRALIVRREASGRLVVLAGNNTLDALRAERRPTARCEIHWCDDDTARRINIADNRIARLAVVDDDALLEQLSYLEGDYAGSGFNDGQVAALLGEGGWGGDPEHEITGHDPDPDPEPDPSAASGSGPRRVVLVLSPGQRAELVDGLDQLAARFDTPSHGATVARLVADALAR